MNWNWKKTAIAGAAAAALVLGGFGWYQWGHTSSEPVYVYQFDFVGMTEYWGDSRESYGPVRTDRIQTVFLSDTQSVKDMLVKEGQSVKKGDVLMTFDTTLDALAVEKKRLEMEKNKLQLEDEETELRRIMGLKPAPNIDPTEPEEPTEPDTGNTISGSYQAVNPGAAGTSSDPYILWVSNSFGGYLDYEFLDGMPQLFERKISSPSALVDESEPNDDGSAEHSYDPDPEPMPEKTYTELEVRAMLEALLKEFEGEYVPMEEAQELEKKIQELEEALEEAPVPFENEFCMVVKSTADNRERGTKTLWQGLEISHDERYQLKIKLFDASGITDPAAEPATTEQDDFWFLESEETETIDMGSGMTAQELAKMRAEQEKKVKEASMKLRMSEAEYKIMAKELGDGNIYAETDGVVISVLEEDEAKSNQQPVLKVSDGGGFYVEGSVSELERDNLAIGQEVTVNNWETGMTYTGAVTEVRDFPNSTDRFYGNGNPNATQYPFVAFVDGTADLREGSYVSISFSAAGSKNGIYLQMPFVRTEKGRSFVYVLGENGRLEERTVTTGKSLWGSYVEILDGLSVTDQIAFPYGKNVKAGVKAVAGDLSNLYGN